MIRRHFEEKKRRRNELDVIVVRFKFVYSVITSVETDGREITVSKETFDRKCHRIKHNDNKIRRVQKN